ncbi:MAG: zf-HC2 domain-containing protein, partial [Thermobispora sp.]|nr:zf-HC2 domain-containing protein [Thermobispora sp.]
MTCEETRMSLGVYVLGALDADEEAAVRAHLEACAACRAEAEELSGLTPLLARVTERDIEQVGEPPRAVLDRLITTAARRGRRRRLLLALAASVSVVAHAGTAWLTVA